jgi:hypothetical protein
MAGTNWEYVLSSTVEQPELNELRADGWEAVGLVTDRDGDPFVLFKRPVERKTPLRR